MSLMPLTAMLPALNTLVAIALCSLDRFQSLDHLS